MENKFDIENLLKH